MDFVDAVEFDRRSKSQWNDFIARIKSGIASSARSVLIKNFDDSESNDLLIKLATSLGQPDKQSGLPRAQIEDEIVFRVECHPYGIRDSRGVVLYSTTHSSFISHTDGSGKPNPYDVVLLYCVRRDEGGGESILITLDELLRNLNAQSIEVLQTNSFPVPFGTAPIISRHGSDTWIRYNSEELTFYSRRRGFEFDQNQKDALAELTATISLLEAEQPKVQMFPGECLVLDNKRALHGRTSFSPNSRRLLKRVRLYWA